MRPKQLLFLSRLVSSQRCIFILSLSGALAHWLRSLGANEEKAQHHNICRRCVSSVQYQADTRNVRPLPNDEIIYEVQLAQQLSANPMIPITSVSTKLQSESWAR